MTKRGMLQNSNEITMGPPAASDGYELNRLVQESPPLDPNSVYCNLLQCTHFHSTSICARQAGIMVGFISGYRIPDRPNTLFVWQVVVAAAARGQGLASRMLTELLQRPLNRDIQFVETTITPSNKASQALFSKLAKSLGTQADISAGFDRDEHFDGKHESEELWRIGPLTEK